MDIYESCTPQLLCQEKASQVCQTNWLADTSLLFEELSKLPLEDHPFVNVFGQQRRQPFSVGVFSTHPNIRRERFTATKRTVNRAPLSLDTLIGNVNKKTNSRFNVARITRFTNGHDFIRPRVEPKGIFDKRKPAIAHLFVGASREIRIQNRNSNKVVSTIVKSGDAIIMRGEDSDLDFSYEFPLDSTKAESSFVCTLYTLSAKRTK